VVPVSASLISRRPPPAVGADSDTVRDARNSPVAQTSSFSEPRVTRPVGVRRAAIGPDGIARSRRDHARGDAAAATTHSNV